jgi:hypothetical protein
VEATEAAIDLPLPPLLRRLYTEVGNGGFGPGYGLLGLAGGYGDHLKQTAVDVFKDRKLPSSLFPICDWGCGILSLVDLRNGRMWGYDPNPVEDMSDALFPQSMLLTEWFSRWLEGSLHQPWVVRDLETDRWRGATDAEYQYQDTLGDH